MTRETPNPAPFNILAFCVSYLYGMAVFAVLVLLFVAAVFLYIYLVFDVIPFIDQQCKNSFCMP